MWWARRCLAVLGAGWDKVGLRQLSGMLVLIFARQVRCASHSDSDRAGRTSVVVLGECSKSTCRGNQLQYSLQQS